MIDVETESTFRFIDAVKGAGYEIADIRKDLAHMLASAMFNGMFEVVMHDLSREDARQYILKLQEFSTRAGINCSVFKTEGRKTPLNSCTIVRISELKYRRTYGK